MLSSKDVENVVLEMQEIASETILNHISRFKTARTVNEQKKVIESFENIFRTNLKNSQSLLFEKCGRTKEKNSRNIWRLKK